MVWIPDQIGNDTRRIVICRKLKPKEGLKMIDIAKIEVRAGNGGNGCISFRREKFVPKGGPDGGDGGKGGDVYLQSSEEKHTLRDFQYKAKFEAENARDGEGAKKTGRSGEDLYILIPRGAIIRESSQDFKIKDYKKLLQLPIVADLSEKNQSFLIAKGGRGGRGNDHFKSAVNQTPRIAEPGEKSEAKWLFLELKLMADVGIVGLPNAGKSTLISRLTLSRPKIAPYPFTTLEPNLGVAEAEGKSFVVADIPGLIAGASQGKGLGYEFLRHIERTKILVHLIGPGDPKVKVGDVLKDMETINRELSLFDTKLGDKAQILVINKIDLSWVRDVALEIERSYKRKGVLVIGISAATGEGLEKLKREIVLRLFQAEKEAQKKTEEEETIPIFEIEDLLKGKRAK